MNKFKCIIFDLDGTLIDSGPILFKIYKQFLEKYGHIGTKKEFKLLDGPKLNQIIHYLKNKYNLKPSVLKLKKDYDNEITKKYQTKIWGCTGILQKLSAG